MELYFDFALICPLTPERLRWLYELKSETAECRRLATGESLMLLQSTHLAGSDKYCRCRVLLGLNVRRARAFTTYLAFKMLTKELHKHVVFINS